MFYPEDTLKGYWDLLISLILIIRCSVTPFAIAFYDQNDTEWNLFDLITDVFFLADILIIFNTAFYDVDYKIVDQYGPIAYNYIKGWFLLDLIAIIPFNYLVNASSNINEMARIFRIGRLYKLIKLLRLVRVIKIINQRN